MKTRVVARITAAVGTAGIALAISAVPAGAHIGTSEDSVAAGASLALGLTVGHGCDGSPTTELAIQIPEGINNATPFAHPGWTPAMEIETLTTPVTSAHGEEVTERVAVITFTATPGNELTDGIRDTFHVNFTAPDTPGETLFFKTVQTCEAGSTAWIEEYDGEGEEPESPAPSIAVTEAEEEGGHGGAEAPAEEPEGTDDDGTDASDAPAAADDGDDSSNGLAIAGIVLGGLGLATGGAALAKVRKTA